MGYNNLSLLIIPQQVSRLRTSNYIPHILWDVITCPCPWSYRATNMSAWCVVTVRRQTLWYTEIIAVDHLTTPVCSLFIGCNIIQLSAVITWSSTVSYCINSYRNWQRRSIRCWIHKIHSIPCPKGQAEVSFVNIDCVVIALHCMYVVRYDSSDTAVTTALEWSHMSIMAYATGLSTVCSIVC